MKSINAIPEEGKFVLMFSSNHCPYCKQMEKTLKQVEKEYSQKGISFFVLNISNNTEIAEKYSIRSTPQTFFVHGKKLVGQELGAVSKKAVEMQLDDLVKDGEFIKKLKRFFFKK